MMYNFYFIHEFGMLYRIGVKLSVFTDHRRYRTSGRDPVPSTLGPEGGPWDERDLRVDGGRTD